MRRLILALILPVMVLLAGCGTIEEPNVSTIIGNPGVMVVDDDGNIVTIDENTRSLTTIEFEHHQLHAGDLFSCWYMQEVSDTGDKSIVTFKTADTTRWLHLTITGSATVMAHFRMLEAPAITNNTGDNLTVYNRNRNSLTTTTVWNTATNPDTQGQATYFTELTMGNVVGGTEVSHMHLGTGEGKKTLGGATRGAQEWILKPDTLYAFEIESINDDDNTHVIELDWYEHTNE